MAERKNNQGGPTTRNSEEIQARLLAMRLVEEGHKKFARQFPVDPPVAATRSHHKGGKLKDATEHKPAGADVATAAVMVEADTAVLPVNIPDVDERGRVNMFGPTSMRGKESLLAAAQRTLPWRRPWRHVPGSRPARRAG